MNQNVLIHWRTTVFGLLQLILGTLYNYLTSIVGGVLQFNWEVFVLQLLIAITFGLMKDDTLKKWISNE